MVGPENPYTHGWSGYSQVGRQDGTTRGQSSEPVEATEGPSETPDTQPKVIAAQQAEVAIDAEGHHTASDQGVEGAEEVTGEIEQQTEAGHVTSVPQPRDWSGRGAVLGPGGWNNNSKRKRV